MGEKIKATLPDGSKMEVEKGTSIQELAKKIGPRLAKDALAGKINGELVDLNTFLSEDSSVEVVTFSSPEGPDIYRHSVSHVMAQAVGELYPEAKFGIGPAIEDGFYYDFGLKTSLPPDDLIKIEKQMKKIIQRNLPFTREEMSKGKAKELFKSLNQ